MRTYHVKLLASIAANTIDEAIGITDILCTHVTAHTKEWEGDGVLWIQFDTAEGEPAIVEITEKGTQ